MMIKTELSLKNIILFVEGASHRCTHSPLPAQDKLPVFAMEVQYPGR